MDHPQIPNLTNETSDYKYATRKWGIINDQLNANYCVGNDTIYNTKVLILIFVITMMLTFYLEVTLPFKQLLSLN